MKSMKNILINLRDIGILTITVFFFYELLWFTIVEDPIQYLRRENIMSVVIEFLFCAAYCICSFLLNLRAEKIARKRLETVHSKIILLTIGILLVNFIWAWIYSVLVDSISVSITGEPFTDIIDIYAVAVISTLVNSLMMTAIFIKAYVKEVELRKQEKDIATDITIRNLQLQISPHFLFNSLSALSTLIYVDPDKADKFINHLALFYRNTLRNVPNKFIPVTEELEQLKDYLFLIQTRFEDALEIKIDTTKIPPSLMIPPGSMQLLVENCIKHNSFSSQQPLHIDIMYSDYSIIVKNDYRPLDKRADSLKVGQNNLKERFRLLNSESVTIKHDEKTYSVTIPLIRK